MPAHSDCWNGKALLNFSGSRQAVASACKADIHQGKIGTRARHQLDELLSRANRTHNGMPERGHFTGQLFGEEPLVLGDGDAQRPSPLRRMKNASLGDTVPTYPHAIVHCSGKAQRRGNLPLSCNRAQPFLAGIDGIGIVANCFGDLRIAARLEAFPVGEVVLEPLTEPPPRLCRSCAWSLGSRHGNPGCPLLIVLHHHNVHLTAENGEHPHETLDGMAPEPSAQDVGQVRLGYTEHAGGFALAHATFADDGVDLANQPCLDQVGIGIGQACIGKDVAAADGVVW